MKNGRDSKWKKAREDLPFFNYSLILSNYSESLMITNSTD